MKISEAFQILGVSEDSTKKTIRKAYLTLAKVAHPDAGGTVEAFTRVNTAYEVAQTRVCPECKGKGFTLKQKGFGSARITCTSC